MFKLWSDLFKGAEPTTVLARTANEDIGDDWIDVQDADTSQVINITAPVELTEEMKERRRKWAKRLQKGRPNLNIPAKAQLRKRRSARVHDNLRPTASTSAQALDQHSQLRAKLKLAQTNAASQQHSEPLASATKEPSGSLSCRSAVRKAKIRVNSRAAKRTRVIQQPAVRGQK